LALIACPDCGALFPASNGPTHPYIGGSAGCWAAFAELGAEEIALGIGGPSRLSVHIYAVQHPGVEGRRQAQSVDVHLMVLGAVLGRATPVDRAVAAMQGWLRDDVAFPWLAPPARPVGHTTVASISRGAAGGPGTSDESEHAVRVRAWAEDVWGAWSDQHVTIRDWLHQGRVGRSP
jgi:Family of unknown function (DUF5946)